MYLDQRLGLLGGLIFDLPGGREVELNPMTLVNGTYVHEPAWLSDRLSDADRAAVLRQWDLTRFVYRVRGESEHAH